jgi:hypothetical protein
MTEKEKKAATPRGRKKKEVKEEHIASIGPGSSPELVHEEIGRAADVVSVKEAPKEEGDWGTFEDRGKAVPDPMIEEGTGTPRPATDANAPSLMGEDEQNEKPAGVLEGEFTIQGEDRPKQTGQARLDGKMVAKVKVYLKPPVVPMTIELEKFKLNTTEEGFQNRQAKLRAGELGTDDLRQELAPKLKIVKEKVVMKGDFDAALDTMVDFYRGKVEAEYQHVGDD